METETKKYISKTEALRVLKETKKRILAEVASLNKKREYGRAVTTDDYVAMAISLLQPEHLDQIRDRTLSNQDRLAKRYKEHCEKNGKITMDEFLGTLLASGGTQ